MGLAPSRVFENPTKTVVSRCLSQFVNTLLGRKAETALEAERAVDGVPAAAGGVFAVSAFAASVWHGWLRFRVEDR